MVMAQIYTKCGSYNEAIDIIEYLLSLETTFTVNDFRMNPLLKPLGEDSRFQAIMQKYDHREGT